jgi:hypothetical protein
MSVCPPHPEDQKFLDPCTHGVVCNRCGAVLALYAKGIPYGLPYPVRSHNSPASAQVVDTKKLPTLIRCPGCWREVGLSDAQIEKIKKSDADHVSLPCCPRVSREEVLKRAKG